MSGRRARVVAASVAALAIFALTPAGAQQPDPEPHVTDPAGDANFGLFSGDTRPASYDPADVLSVRFETDYVAIPVGEDGIHYRPTALITHYDTLAPPRTDGPTISWDVVANIGGCQSRLLVGRRGMAGLPGDPEDGVLHWQQSGADCPDGPSAPGATNPLWSVVLDEQDGGWRWRIPFDSLSPEQAAYLGPGRSIQSPRAATYAFLVVNASIGGFFLFRIDNSETGRTFVIGEDVPPDVPCTRGCPED